MQICVCEHACVHGVSPFKYLIVCVGNMEHFQYDGSNTSLGKSNVYYVLHPLFVSQQSINNREVRRPVAVIYSGKNCTEVYENKSFFWKIVQETL